MFPYKDDNPTLSAPVVTVLLIGLNVLVWILIQGMGTEPRLSVSVCELGFIPGEVLHRLPPGTLVSGSGELECVIGSGRSGITLLTSTFLHGGWFHLIGNMWFMWVFGNNVEDSMGRIRFFLFYVVCGLIAALTQAVVNPASGVPMVGASGAISGVMGAYIVLYPRVRVHMLIFLGFIFFRTVVPAYLMLGYWFLLQLLGALPMVSREEGGGVAFWAHAGGFVAGIVLVQVFRNPRLVALRRAHALP